MKILVVKLGSSSVTRASGPDPRLLTNTLDSALEAHDLGWGVVIVSSGAVSSGTAHLARTGVAEFSGRLAAAVGQPYLLAIYRSVADMSGRNVAQILLADQDLRNPRKMAVIAQVLRESVENGVIPIVNGNDATDEAASDNDAIAAGVAVMTGADKLLLLTDVDGVYEHSPAVDAAPIPEINAHEIHEVTTYRGGTGRGGMRSKVRAAELAAHNGIETMIASARRPSAVIDFIKDEPRGTRVRPTNRRFDADRRWIAGVAVSHGALVVNLAAETGIGWGSSLFASGIKRVRGTFRPGDVVDIVSPQGRLLGRGVSRTSALLVELVRSMSIEEIALVLVGVLRRFADAGTQLAATSPARPVVHNALARLDRMSPENIRTLAIEILTLYPSAAVAAMLPNGQRTASDRLLERFVHVVDDLSFIDRSRLVVYHPFPPSPAPG
ncbi:glutamate 5-kinase [Frankia sp. AgB1.9]|uniref:glutamate 5-kinase n=1 Tax=unclassified Frankia TaxID=2632575 RepID=UPI001934A7FA|nr:MULTISPECIES: glutamate 5-kinase [unclassified Frankia]MBL7494408.1 glutamate 5-kinase [Frankia sp. AgW1.1]MBL7551361.1 glutamate 5-kinase [Frankia sp. AgB1.9]MBL7624154.1 glutamate 5-kinase [Frankia sp. AgB1.8]